MFYDNYPYKNHKVATQECCVMRACMCLQLSMVLNFFFNLAQFFDRDGDGIVSKADLSGHLPRFGSLPHLRGSNSHQKQDHDALPNEMNMGEYMIIHVANFPGSGIMAFLYIRITIEQFSSLLSLHPEYALIFHECQHADVSSSPTATYSAMNGNSNYNNSQSMAKANDVTMTSCDSHVMHRGQGSPTVHVH